MGFGEGFSGMLDSLGSDIEVIRDIGTAAEARHVFRGVKNRETGHPKREYFGFAHGADVRGGDVIHPVKTNDFWDVSDTESQMAAGEVVQLKVYVEKRTGQGAVRAKAPVVPIELKNLHPEVIRVAGKYVADGHYRPAIQDTFIALEERVQAKTGSSDIGASLMQSAFSQKAPILRLSEHDEEQAGFMMLYTGAVKAIRNGCGSCWRQKSSEIS